MTEDRLIAALCEVLRRLPTREDYPPTASHLLREACHIHHAFSYEPPVDPTSFAAVVDAAQALQRALDALGWAEIQVLRYSARGLPWEQLDALYEVRLASARSNGRDPEEGQEALIWLLHSLERGAADLTDACRGRPRSKRASAVADVTLLAFEQITGEPATRRTEAETNKPYGPFHFFVAEVFKALGMTDSAANQARQAIERRDLMEKSGAN